jgi:hypothetical protein
LGATEPQRLALHAAARAALGAEEGDTLMALTPPANTEMATRQDLERVELRLGARMTALEERLVARIDKSAGQLRTYAWKLVVGTGVGLYLATVATVLGGIALLR